MVSTAPVIAAAGVPVTFASFTTVATPEASDGISRIPMSISINVLTILMFWFSPV